MNIKILLNKEIDLEINPNLDHWNEASNEEKILYIRNIIAEEFTLNDMIFDNNIEILS